MTFASRCEAPKAAPHFGEGGDPDEPEEPQVLGCDTLRVRERHCRGRQSPGWLQDRKGIASLLAARRADRREDRAAWSCAKGGPNVTQTCRVVHVWQRFLH